MLIMGRGRRCSTKKNISSSDMDKLKEMCNTA